MNAAPKPPKRARPLRRESNDHLWFVTCRIIEGRFWLHPILTSAIEPPNHKARRAAKAMMRHLDKRLGKLVERANAQSGPNQPKLTLEDARRMARGLIGSALARAQKHCEVKVYALVVMSNHLHLIETSWKLAGWLGGRWSRRARERTAVAPAAIQPGSYGRAGGARSASKPGDRRRRIISDEPLARLRGHSNSKVRSQLDVAPPFTCLRSASRRPRGGLSSARKLAGGGNPWREQEVPQNALASRSHGRPLGVTAGDAQV
ncbi:MAG: hypothetical protein OEZ06_06215 [Myxococcales bacterium]|nr:hypothetical protein [Myxococcales bacterium]